MSNSNNINSPKTNGTQACAACKYQRRKCAPDCILAPYFPHDRQRQFLNAHKLFGVSNITKIIKNLDQPEKDEAMRTIIFQSDVRANDPVGGCYRIIRDLQRQIDYYKSELDIVYHHLQLCRAQAEAEIQQEQQILVVPDAANNVIVNGADPLSNTFDEIDYHQEQFQPHQPHQEEYNIKQNDHAVPLQEVISGGLQESTSSSLPVMPQSSDNNECDDNCIKPFLDLPLDKQEFKFDFDDAFHQSSFKFEDEDTIGRSNKDILAEGKPLFHEEGGAFHHAQYHDLKSAATFFSLTNCHS